jgi:hypothetical protein
MQRLIGHSAIEEACHVRQELKTECESSGIESFRLIHAQQAIRVARSLS